MSLPFCPVHSFHVSLSLSHPQFNLNYGSGSGGTVAFGSPSVSCSGSEGKSVFLRKPVQ